MSDLDNQAAAPVRVGIAVKKERALELRMKGWSYRRIAKELTIGKTQANKYVREALRELDQTNRELADELRTLDLRRLDDMLEQLWDGRGDPRTADTILRIQQRRADLLGLDAPKKLEQTGAGGAPLIPQQADLSKLTLDELRQYEALTMKAAGATTPPAAEPPASS